jgi:hypothetical protein
MFCPKNLLIFFCVFFAAKNDLFPNEYKWTDLHNGDNCRFSCEVGMEFLTHHLEGLQISKF